MKKLLFLAVVSLSIISCGKKGGATESAYTPASPEEGAWHTNCSKCHSLKRADPVSHTAAEWTSIVNKMQSKRGGNQFSDDQKALIMKYFAAHAKS
jgi:hypothetical protein